MQQAYMKELSTSFKELHSNKIQSCPIKREDSKRQKKSTAV
jgi:aminoglycoside phosphotransferase